MLKLAILNRNYIYQFYIIKMFQPLSTSKALTLVTCQSLAQTLTMWQGVFHQITTRHWHWNDDRQSTSAPPVNVPMENIISYMVRSRQFYNVTFYLKLCYWIAKLVNYFSCI